MPKLHVRHQVFISFAAADRDLAGRVVASLRAGGVDVVGMRDFETSGSYDDEVREAITASEAFVVALSVVGRRQEIPAAVLFEIGAATGAGKPIFVVVDEPTGTLPFRVPTCKCSR